MKTPNQCCEPTAQVSKWQVVLDQILAPPTRIHRYRNLSTRMLEDTMEQHYCGRQRQ